MRELGKNKVSYSDSLRNEVTGMKYINRLVRTPGFIIAYKKFWNSEKLKPYIGRYVAVSALNKNCSEVNIYKGLPSRFEYDLICTIEKGV